MPLRKKLALIFSSALLLVSFIEASDNLQPKRLTQPVNLEGEPLRLPPSNVRFAPCLPFSGGAPNPRPATKGSYPLGTPDYRLTAASRGAYPPIVKILSYPNIKLHGFIFNALVDEVGNLLLMFFKNGLYCVSHSSAYPLTRYGHGPGEINSWRAMCFSAPFLIVVETTGRILYFRRTGDIYNYDKTEWIRDLPSIFFKSVERVGNKWFFAGFTYDHSITMQKKHPAGYFLSIFENGQFKKSLLYREFLDRRYYPHLIRVFIRKHGPYLYLLIETEPKIYVIDPERLEIIKIHELKMPDNYVRIGKEAFIKNKNRPVPQLFEDWELSYSRIENFIINEDYFLLQFRNLSKDQKKFTLLLINQNNFFLENIFYTDDAMLAEKDDLVYFLANGDPGLDEEADSLIINVYSLK
ncbi:MAG: hypothetical protein QME85_11305 [Candidatus Saccharicenans sp.]|nr:hypothetical protein [Candidatus Saccharicenans sp.]